MKGKGALLAILSLVLAGTAMAGDKPIDLGIKGGLNMASLAFDPELPDEADMPLYMRFGGGAVLTFHANPSIAVDLEALYMMKGAKITSDMEFMGETFEVESQTNLDYLVLCPMLRFTPAMKGVAPYFMVGPEIGLLMAAKEKSEVTVAGETEEEEVDIKDDLKSTDLALNFGAGLAFPSGNMSFFLEGRYSMGMTDISDPEEAEPTAKQEDEDEATLKTRGIYVLAGVRF